MKRILTLAAALACLCAAVGCEQTKGNTPAAKQETVAPQSSMEAYKTGQPGKAAQK